MLLPVAIMSGEVWTFSSGGDKIGFLDRADLQTPVYLFLNLFAGERCVDILKQLVQHDWTRWISCVPDRVSSFLYSLGGVVKVVDRLELLCWR